MRRDFHFDNFFCFPERLWHSGFHDTHISFFKAYKAIKPTIQVFDERAQQKRYSLVDIVHFFKKSLSFLS